jgi:hypothetical protein
MSSSGILGLVRAWIVEGDNAARMALTDVFAEAGDEDTAKLLREGGFPLAVVFGSPEELNYNFEAVCDDQLDQLERLVHDFRFNSIGERLAFERALTAHGSDDCDYGTHEDVLKRLRIYFGDYSDSGGEVCECCQTAIGEVNRPATCAICGDPTCDNCSHREEQDRICWTCYENIDRAMNKDD